MLGEMTEKTVLVVDDSPISLKHASAILKGRCRVACAKSGAMALSYLERQKPDLILLDVNMPEMDGLTVYHTLRAKAPTRDIPVLFLTGLEDEQYRDKLEGVPAAQIVHKPAQPELLLARIAAFLQ